MSRSKPPEFYYPEEGSQLPSLIDYVREREAREFELGVTVGIFDTTFRLLRSKIGPLGDRLQNQIDLLSLEQVKQLGIALLKFESKTDLTNWLKAHPPHYKQTCKAAKSA